MLIPLEIPSGIFQDTVWSFIVIQFDKIKINSKELNWFLVHFRDNYLI